MEYADVILPVPLDGAFTYSVPASFVTQIAVGMRVVVPFGKTKTLTGVVLRLHDRKPDVTCKDILRVLDEQPMVTQRQLTLWQWIADYYLSPLGDILKAALPSGLKDEEGYRPRTEQYVKLGETYRTEQGLHVALDLLRRAVRQKEVFLCYLQLSHWDSLSVETPQQPIVEVTREELMNTSHTTSAVLANLFSRKFLVTYEKQVGRLNDGGSPHPEHIKPLNPAQTEAYNKIVFEHLSKPVVLLHGVTSSGKTEIYIHLIQKALDEHKQVLYLLPEIALTVQIMTRLRNVFGNRLGIYHSKYSDAERVEIWQKQLSDQPYDIILGARSAVFLPFQHLGLIVVDEEHETSFKQQDPAPRYHARSVAIVLARMYANCKVLLGTATPSMETYHNAVSGKFGLVELTHRYKDLQLPKIEVVDIKDLQHRKMMNGPFSPQLLVAIRKALAQGEQVILFQNRRGFAPMIECRTCGWVPKCVNCDVTLTVHKRLNALTCHYCGHTVSIPEVCPNCGEKHLMGRGFGTEKVEDYIRELFPEARVARMDLDTTRTRKAYERLIGDFASGKTNLLVGTQMISKGLDFDKVSVVGILNADTMLNMPDFRAYEYAFAMMAQVSGRAGRKGHQGMVYLQTRNPDLPVIQQVVHNDFKGFYRGVLEERKLFSYPPFTHVVNVFLKHRKDNVVESAALELGSRLRTVFGDRVLGPDKPSVARVKQQFIRKLILKMETGLDYKKMRLYLRQTQAELMKDKRYGALTVYYDVDPQ